MNPGETPCTTESSVALNIHTQVQMLIHAVLALNWSNYLLKESVKGMLSILLIEFSKVKLNCMPFQLLTRFCLACFKNGKKKKLHTARNSSPTHTVSFLIIKKIQDMMVQEERHSLGNLCPFFTIYMPNRQIVPSGV